MRGCANPGNLTYYLNKASRLERSTATVNVLWYGLVAIEEKYLNPPFLIPVGT